MFKDDYENIMNNVSASDETKRKILENFEAQTEKSKKAKNPAIPWRIGFAIAACAAVILSAIFIPKNNIFVKNEPTTGVDNKQTLSTAESYKSIYKLLDKLADKQADDVVLYEYAIEETETFAAGGASDNGATKGTAKPNTSQKKEDTNSTAAKNDSAEKTEYSETNTQVEGVDEADIVKTDGKYIYYLYNGYLQIVKPEGSQTRLITTLTLPEDKNYSSQDMFLYKDRLVIIANVNTDTMYSKYIGAVDGDYSYGSGSKEATELMIYDVSNPEKIKSIGSCSQSGYYQSARMIGENIFIVSNSYINCNKIDKNKPETFVPSVECKGETEVLPAESIMLYGDEEITSSVFLTVCSYSSLDASLVDSSALLGGCDEIYCNSDNIITANSRHYSDDKIGYSYTLLSRFAISEGKIEYKATGKIDGSLDNQFAMDEHGEYFRFVTTVDRQTYSEIKSGNSSYTLMRSDNERYAALFILDNKLETVGKLEKLAEGERVYSVRFMGDIAYFVTFRQTDPLFSADLSDPKNPKIIGKLKIPGFSEYLYPYGENTLLGIGMDADEKTGRQGDVKLSVFDTTDSSNVTEKFKEIIDSAYYSPALNSHKAALISSSENLIGLPVVSQSNIKGKPDVLSYRLFSISDNGFEQKASFDLSTLYNSESYYISGYVRGAFIGDYFYLLSPAGLKVYTLDNFNEVSSLDFSGYEAPGTYVYAR